MSGPACPAAWPGPTRNHLAAAGDGTILKTALIGVDDACRGVETSTGRMYQSSNGVIEMPAHEAREVLDSGAPNLHRHRRVRHGWSAASERGWDAAFGKENDL